MQDYINEAINIKDTSDDERPKKKQKKNDEEPNEGNNYGLPKWLNGRDLPKSSEEEQHVMLRKQLKILLTNHPNTDLKYIEDLDHAIDQMSITEIQEKIDNIKLALGMKQPNETAESVLGALGTFVELWTGRKGVKERFMSDPELISALEVYVPDAFRTLSIPLKIGYRLTGHISDLCFNQESFGPKTPSHAAVKTVTPSNESNLNKS